MHGDLLPVNVLKNSLANEKGLKRAGLFVVPG